MGIKQQDQHTNIWDTNGLIPHQSRVDSQTCPILGQTPTTYLFVFRQTMATTHRKRLDYTATSDTTNITSGHNPGVTSQTLTSGPLTRRRVIIHVEDHTPSKPTDKGSTYRLLRTPQDSLRHSCLIYDQNPLEKCFNHTKSTDNHSANPFIDSSHPGTQRARQPDHMVRLTVISTGPHYITSQS